jgi:hypothetical protein
MRFKRGDVINTSSNKNHKKIIELLHKHGYKIDRTTWDDRDGDWECDYFRLRFSGKKISIF